jgi:hypothetical protein
LRDGDEAYCKIEVLIGERRSAVVGAVGTLCISIITTQVAQTLGADITDWAIPGDLIRLVLALTTLYLLHEYLHVAGHILWGKAEASSVRVGFDWKHLRPYCLFTKPARMSVFRIVCILPFLGITLVCTPLLILYPSGWVAIVAGVAMGSCATDLYTLVITRNFLPDDVVTGRADGVLGYLVFRDVDLGLDTE